MFTYRCAADTRTNHPPEAVRPAAEAFARSERRDYPGQIVEVELEHDDHMWLYEIKLLRTEGSLVKLKLNASDGTLLGIKGRDITPGPLPKAKP